LAFGLKVELGPSFAVLDLDEKVGLAQFGLAVKSGSFLWAVGYVKLVSINNAIARFLKFFFFIIFKKAVSKEI
jgi:hypothetical protein